MDDADTESLLKSNVSDTRRTRVMLLSVGGCSYMGKSVFVELASFLLPAVLVAPTQDQVCGDPDGCGEQVGARTGATAEYQSHERAGDGVDRRLCADLASNELDAYFVRALMSTITSGRTAQDA